MTLLFILAGSILLPTVLIPMAKQMGKRSEQAAEAQDGKHQD